MLGFIASVDACFYFGEAKDASPSEGFNQAVGKLLFE